MCGTGVLSLLFVKSYHVLNRFTGLRVIMC